MSSATSGRLADRYGRRAVLLLGCLVALLGVGLTLPASLPLLVVGLALVIGGFFASYGVASSGAGAGRPLVVLPAGGLVVVVGALAVVLPRAEPAARPRRSVGGLA